MFLVNYRLISTFLFLIVSTTSTSTTTTSDTKCPIIDEKNLPQKVQANHHLNDSSLFDVGFTLEYVLGNNLCLIILIAFSDIQIISVAYMIQNYTLFDRYTCENNKDIVNIKKGNDIASSIVSTCQLDGQWSKNILEYQCLGKNNSNFQVFSMYLI